MIDLTSYGFKVEGRAPSTENKIYITQALIKQAIAPLKPVFEQSSEYVTFTVHVEQGSSVRISMMFDDMLMFNSATPLDPNDIVEVSTYALHRRLHSSKLIEIKAHQVLPALKQLITNEHEETKRGYEEFASRIYKFGDRIFKPWSNDVNKMIWRSTDLTYVVDVSPGNRPCAKIVNKEGELLAAQLVFDPYADPLQLFKDVTSKL